MKSNNSIEVTLHQSYKHHHKCLRMTVNIHQIERLFFRINPKIKKYQDLKEEYISFNQGTYENEEQVKESLDSLIIRYENSKEKIFIDFSSFLKEHMNEIVRSFTIVQVSRKSNACQANYYARLSNGPMESFNRKPKDYKRITRGSSNFDYTRNHKYKKQCTTCIDCLFFYEFSSFFKMN